MWDIVTAVLLSMFLRLLIDEKCGPRKVDRANLGRRLTGRTPLGYGPDSRGVKMFGVTQ